MELLGERPVWSMSDGELLPTLDQVDAAVAWLLTYRLQLVARVDEIGLAEELGARDTAELLAMRHRIDRREAHRDVKLARSLPKYDAVSTALADETRPLRPGAGERDRDGAGAGSDQSSGRGSRCSRGAVGQPGGPFVSR